MSIVHLIFEVLGWIAFVAAALAVTWKLQSKLRQAIDVQEKAIDAQGKTIDAQKEYGDVLKDHLELERNVRAADAATLSNAIELQQEEIGQLRKERDGHAKLADYWSSRWLQTQLSFTTGFRFLNEHLPEHLRQVEELMLAAATSSLPESGITLQRFREVLSLAMQTGPRPDVPHEAHLYDILSVGREISSTSIRLFYAVRYMEEIAKPEGRAIAESKEAHTAFVNRIFAEKVDPERVGLGETPKPEIHPPKP